MDIADDQDYLVIDNGSGTLKAGFAGDGAPQLLLSNLVCSTISSAEQKKDDQQHQRHRQQRQRRSFGIPEDNSDLIDVCWPVRRGVVEHWDAMEQMWQHTVDHLRVTPDHYNTLLSAHPITQKSQLSKTSEIWLEKLGANSLMLEVDSKLGLYGSGLSTGLALDMGFGVSSVTPIVEGTVVRAEANNLDVGVIQAGFGGSDVSFALSSYMSTEGYSPSTQFLDDFSRLESIKHDHCFIRAYTGNSDGKEAAVPEGPNIFFTLPDGRKLDMGSSRWRATEKIFAGDFSLPEMVHNSILQCDIDVRRYMTDAVVLLGGTTKLRGFSERLKAELGQLFKSRAKIQTVTQDTPENACWTGGSILGMLPQFRNMWLSKEEYEEYGSDVASTRFLSEITEARYLGALALQLPKRSTRVENLQEEDAPGLNAIMAEIAQLPEIPEYSAQLLAQINAQSAFHAPLTNAYELAVLAENSRKSLFADLKKVHEEQAKGFFDIASGKKEMVRSDLERKLFANNLMMKEAIASVRNERDRKEAFLLMSVNNPSIMDKIEKLCAARSSGRKRRFGKGGAKGRRRSSVKVEKLSEIGGFGLSLSRMVELDEVKEEEEEEEEEGGGENETTE